MIIADGIDLPSPDIYEVPTGDLDSEGSGRNELGYMQRDRLREGVRTIKLGWAMATEEEAARILGATKKDEFSVTYLDPEYGIVTKIMYASPKSTKLVFSNGRDKRWSISFDLIQK